MTDTISRTETTPEGPVPPQALEAERAVLAAMLLDGEAVARAIEMIEAPVFYRSSHQKIFEAMTSLFSRNEKIDLITLSEELRKRGDLEAVGGAAALVQIIEYAATSAHLEQHVRIVHSKSVLRSLIKATSEIQQECYAGSDETPAILDRAEQRIFQITDERVRQGFISMKDLMMPTMKHIEELAERKTLITGIPSGYDDLDKLTSGFQKSDLVIIAGRPSMGKCLAWDSEIVLDDGEVVTIEELFQRRDSRVGTLRDDLKLDRAMPSDYVDDGLKPVFEVTTRLGRRVETTLPHPFLTLEGWKPLAELRVGDNVAVPRELPVFGNEPMRECEIKRIADRFGSIGSTVTTHSMRSAEAVRRSSTGSGGSTALMEHRRTSLACVFEQGSRDVVIPASVFRLPRAQLAFFLRHLYSRDDRANVSFSGQARLSYSCPNERSARQLSHLLLRFGVVAQLCEDAEWQIDITEADSRQRFCTEMGFLEGAGIQRALVEGPGTRAKCGDVYWDRIESIVPAGVKQVYDLTIPGTHNFVANDVCVHNTSFAMNIAENSAIQHQKHVAILSLEMSKEQLALRLLCSQSEVPLHKVRSGHLNETEFRRLVNLTGGLYKAGLLIDDTAAPTVLEIRAKCRRLRAENRLDMVLIDYLQLIRSSGRSENRTQEISQITRALKGLAKELDIPVVALSQLSRAPEGRGQGERRPQLSDLRESGCLTADTRISRADTGASPTLGELLERGETNFPVWSMDPDMRLTCSVMTRVFSSGIKPVFELKMASGLTLKASGNHPFYAFDGWKALGDLRPGDRLAAPRRIPEQSETSAWSESKVILLAHLLGDGCFASRQPLHYTNEDERNLAAVEHAAEEFGITPRRVPQGSWQHVYLPSPYRLARGRRNPIVGWLATLGLAGLRSYQKFIPHDVFALSNEQLSLFIRHLWATDGCVHLGKGSQARIYYASTSLRLVLDLRALLMRFGILGRLKTTTKAHYRPSFHLHVTGAENQRVFIEQIGTFGPRTREDHRIRELLQSLRPNTNVDTVPVEVWNQVRGAMKQKGVTTRALAAGLGTAYCGSTLFKHSPSRERFGRVAGLLEEPALDRLAGSDVFWDTITSITPLGPQPVFDATVPGTHNFIANGIFAHNSIEQDADVVLFVFREEMYKRDDPSLRGKADIIIAKQRNGPTGDVKLTFLHEFTKFVPYSPVMPGETEPGF